MVMDACSSGFMDFVNGSVLQLSAMAAILTTIIIVFSYYIGQIMNNPKVSVWAKTEIVQIVTSIASVFLIIVTINSFCAIDMNGVAAIFGISGVPSGTDVFHAAQNYMGDTLEFSHNALAVVRYHLQAYTILSQISAFSCDLKIPSFLGPDLGLGCFFSYSGESGQPLGAYNVAMGSLNLFFNTVIMAYMTTLNFLLILQMIYKGYVLFLLPFAIFIRSIPYLRSFGSLLIAVAISFMLIYPLILAIFGLMSGVLLQEPPDMDQFKDETIFPDNGAAVTAGQSLAGAILGAQFFEHLYFPPGGSMWSGLGFGGIGSLGGVSMEAKDNIPGTIAFTAYAFIAGVFLPTVALLAAIASVNYLARIYGEEIDLSRIIQMV